MDWSRADSVQHYRQVIKFQLSESGSGNGRAEKLLSKLKQSLLATHPSRLGLISQTNRTRSLRRRRVNLMRLFGTVQRHPADPLVSQLGAGRLTDKLIKRSQLIRTARSGKAITRRQRAGQRTARHPLKRSIRFESIRSRQRREPLPIGKQQLSAAHDVVRVLCL